MALFICLITSLTLILLLSLYFFHFGGVFPCFLQVTSWFCYLMFSLTYVLIFMIGNLT